MNFAGVVKTCGIRKETSFDLEVDFSFEIWCSNFLTLLGENGNFEKSCTSPEVGK